MSYHLRIRLGRVVCRDRESLSEYDSFGLTGAVVVDGQVVAFSRPLVAVNERISGGYQDPLVFEGFTESRDVGIVLRGYDVDDGDGWVKHGDQIKEVSSGLAEVVGYVPVVGELAALVLEHWPKVVDAFVEFDTDDLLLSHATTVTLAEVSATLFKRSYQSITVRSSRDDVTGYSDWDYSVSLDFDYENVDVPSFGRMLELTHAPVRLSSPADWAGVWDGERVTCVVSPSAQGGGLLDVVVTERRDPPPPERVSTGVAVSGSWHVDDAVAEVQVSRGLAGTAAAGLIREGTGQASRFGSLEDVRGGQTVELDVARRGLSKLGAVRSPEVIGLDRGTPVKDQAVTDGIGTQGAQSETDMVRLAGDAVLEMYQVLVDGSAGPGRQLRYRSRGSDASARSLHDVDELLSGRVNIT